jgi:hypothetical protein
MRRLGALAVLAATLAVAGFGCADDDSDGETTAPTTTAGTTTSGTTTEASDDFSADPVTGEAAGSEIALLEQITLGKHDGFDRVVFRFRNGVPGYRVEYVEPPLREDGSGNVVEIDGEAFVVVRMEPASGFDLTTGEGELVYTGPRRISGEDAGLRVVRELVRTGDFEAVLSWAVGLEERVGFRVMTLQNPARLVVDFSTTD